jgi:hypothetical protein
VKTAIGGGRVGGSAVVNPDPGEGPRLPRIKAGRGVVGKGVEMRLGAVFAVVTSALVLPAAASASQLIARNASQLRLEVNRKGEALLSYRSGDRPRRVLAWGAVNALSPRPGARQVRFHVDYSGGWGKYGRGYWKSFRDGCRPYDGPALPWLAAACKAPDGSYWAVQRFPQALPNLGFAPWLPEQRAVWLELSHWRGPLPRLEVWQTWVYSGRYNQIFGRFSYDGEPVYGFATTHAGAPTDGFGRLVYLDTFDAPAYGPGWRRENSFVSHSPSGVFCYGFYAYDPVSGGYRHPPGQQARRGPGLGSRLRLTAQGPGVTPDVSWLGPALPRFDRASSADRALEAQMTALLRELGDRRCLAGH